MYVPFIVLRLTKISLTFINLTRVRTQGQSAGQSCEGTLGLYGTIPLKTICRKSYNYWRGEINNSRLHRHST